MQIFLDRLASILAALATIAVCAGPSWFSHLAIQAELVPIWGYGFVAALGWIGLVMTFAFIRKAYKGISPSRSRRR